MSSRKNYLADVEQDAERYNAEVIHCSIVEKINVTSKGGEPRILLITNLFIAFYKVQAKPSPLRMDYWCDLERVELRDSVFTFTFGQSKPLKFSSGDSKLIKAKLGDLLQRVLTKSEQKAAHVSCLTSRRFPMTRNGVYARFLSFAGMFQLHLKPSVREFVENIFVNRHPDVVIPPFPELARLETGILYALNGVPGVESLTIPAVKSVDPFEILTEGFMSPCGFRHIHFDGVSITKNYLNWCRCVVEDTESSLTGLTFSNVKFKQKELMEIQKIATERRFTSIGFINSIKEKHYDAFLKTFMIADTTSSLQMITINNQNNLPIDKLIFKARDLCCLSLANCNVDIFLALEHVAQNKMGKLRLLNLSGNYAQAPSKPISLPDNLQKLQLDEVEWKERSMVPLWSYLCEKEWNGVFEFSMSQAKAAETEWNALKIFMTNSKRSCISGLTWTFNPVFSELVKFLENSQHLVFLDFSNAFCPTDSTILNMFANALKDFEFLTTLTVASDESHDLQTNAIQLIRMAARLPHIQNLVVTGNSIGDEGVQVMGEFVRKNPSIKCVCFDGSRMSSLDTWTRFIENARYAGRQILVEWPQSDMKRLSEAGHLSQHRMRDFKRDLLSLSGSSIDQYPDQEKDEDSMDGFGGGCENPMTKPFEVFTFVPNRFPLYVSARLTEYFNRPVQAYSPANVSRKSSRKRSLSKLEDEPRARKSGARRRTDAIDFPIESVSNPEKQRRLVMAKLKKQFSFEMLGDILAKDDPY